MNIKDYFTKTFIVLLLLVSFSVAALTNYWSGKTNLKNELDNSSVVAEVPEDKIESVLTVEEEFPYSIGRNVPLYTSLKDLNINSTDIVEMVKATKPVKDLSKLLPGTRFQVIKDENDKLLEAQFRFSAVEKLVVKKDLNNWVATIITETVDVKPISFVGHVRSTLWESALEAKMDPYLIVAMSEIFGWEVDFNREVQVGDSWRISAEQKFVKGQHVGWGSVLAAEYINQGVKHTAALFRLENEDVGYYNLEGESLRRMFLKSPLRFGRVTSRFNRRRFHPKLKVVRPHYGVDYGAPIGTPVRSVADGVVTFAQYSGGGGKVLKIRHNSTYQTAYKHLNGYAKGVRQGARVKQGQVIAYVGNTGLSTGPHLHYEFYVNGSYVDPMRQKFPSAEPVPVDQMSQFLKQAKTLVASLPEWQPEAYEMKTEQSWAQHLTPNIQNKYYLVLDEDFWSLIGF